MHGRTSLYAMVVKSLYDSTASFTRSLYNLRGVAENKRTTSTRSTVTKLFLLSFFFFGVTQRKRAWPREEKKKKKSKRTKKKRKPIARVDVPVLSGQ